MLSFTTQHTHTHTHTHSYTVTGSLGSCSLSVSQARIECAWYAKQWTVGRHLGAQLILLSPSPPRSKASLKLVILHFGVNKFSSQGYSLTATWLRELLIWERECLWGFGSAHLSVGYSASLFPSLSPNPLGWTCQRILEPRALWVFFLFPAPGLSSHGPAPHV